MPCALVQDSPQNKKKLMHGLFGKVPSPQEVPAKSSLQHRSLQKSKFRPSGFPCFAGCPVGHTEQFVAQHASPKKICSTAVPLQETAGAPDRTSATTGQPRERAILSAARQSSGWPIWATTSSPLWAPARTLRSSVTAASLEEKPGRFWGARGGPKTARGADTGAVKGCPDPSHLSSPCEFAAS